MQTFSKLLNFSRGSFWIPTTLCYPQKWNRLSLNPFQAFRFWDIFFKKRGCVSRQLFWVPPTICYPQNWMFCPVTSFQVVRFQKFPSWPVVVFMKWSFWVPTILCYFQNWTFYLVTPFQLVRFEKFPHKQGCFLFQDDHLSTNNLMLTSKLNILSHISVFLNIIWSMLHKPEVLHFKCNSDSLEWLFGNYCLM